MIDWVPDLGGGSRPLYIAIAEAIQGDVAQGRLMPAQRLPAQRQLARQLGLDFTTVARGYAEAQRRGLIVSRVGEGTFVAGSPAGETSVAPVRFEAADFSMNMPPEACERTIQARLIASLEPVGHQLCRLLRYQRFGGTEADKEAALAWLGRRGLSPGPDRVFVVPGAHAALLAALAILAQGGDVVLTEALTYPGTRAIAAQLGIALVGLATDQHGLSVDAFAEACVRHKPKALYLNPTLCNPTTRTIPVERRQAIAGIARAHGIPILEDDPYGAIPSGGPPPIAVLAPDVTWHIATLSKCLGAGLRVAYVCVPDARSGWNFAAAVRTATVMVSPITAALATRWIGDGTGEALLEAVRSESRERQKLVAALLPAEYVTTDPAAFHFWLTLPPRWSRSAFVSHMAACGLGVVASDAFAAAGPIPEAVRVCLGGPAPRAVVRTALEFAAHALSDSPERASTFL